MEAMAENVVYIAKTQVKSRNSVNEVRLNIGAIGNVQQLRQYNDRLCFEQRKYEKATTLPAYYWKIKSKEMWVSRQNDLEIFSEKWAL